MHWPWKLTHGQYYSGPNPWASSPIVLLNSLQNSDATGFDLTVSEREKFNVWSAQTFLSWWPANFGLNSLQGGDVSLALAKWAVQWAHCALNAQRGFIHDFGAQITQEGILQLWVGYHEPILSRRALELSLTILAEGLSVVRGIEGETTSKPLKNELICAIDTLLKDCRQQHPDYQARILMVAAREQGIPVLPFDKSGRLWQFGWGHRACVMFESSIDADGSIGSMVQTNKVFTKSVLKSLGLTVPSHIVVDRLADLPSAMQGIDLPCVLKPIDSGGGKGVSVGLSSLNDLQLAFEHASQYTHGSIMLETMVAGDEFRLMVLGGQFVAAIRRNCPRIVGDGLSTVAELISELNASRCYGVAFTGYLYPVKVDTVVRQCLANQGLTLEAVPVAGQLIQLRGNSNLSTGGTCTDVTADTHPSLPILAESICATLGLHNVGLDYLTTNISLSAKESGGSFIEINTTPGLSALVAAGWSEVKVAGLSLGKRPGRIPACLLVMSNQDRDQLQDHLAVRAALIPGLGYKSGLMQGIGSLVLQNNSAQGLDALYPLLRHRTLKAILIIITAQELMQHGLPLDTCNEAWLCIPNLLNEWRNVLVHACINKINNSAHAAAALDSALDLLQSEVPIQDI